MTADTNRALGFAGSVALAVGGLSAGALPLHDPFGHVPGIRELRAFPLTAMAGAFLGLTLLLGAWLRLRKQGHTPRELTVTLLWWAAPLAIAPPLFSRDVFSYLAQGALVRHGFDAYTVGPSALADDLTLNVPPVWQDTPAPYGPVFLRLAAGVVGLTGEHTVLGVLGLRALAIGGLLLIVRYLPALAARSGADPATALWLGALNPLVLIHLVAGAHNDALMIGLMLAGLSFATRGNMAAAIGLIATATLIKAPDVLALACLTQLWAAPAGPGGRADRGRRPGRRRPADLRARPRARLAARARYPDGGPQRAVDEHRTRTPDRPRHRTGGADRDAGRVRGGRGDGRADRAAVVAGQPGPRTRGGAVRDRPVWTGRAPVVCAVGPGTAGRRRPDPRPAPVRDRGDRAAVLVSDAVWDGADRT